MSNRTQFSKAQQNRMAVGTMNFGSRIVIGYLLSVILIVLSAIQAHDFYSQGDTEHMIYYIILAVFAVLYAVLVTVQMRREIKKTEKELAKRGGAK